ncbi:sigma-54-dependent transcriptional regulator [Thiocapsa marina]|uniref:Two component, sigma54 specific, transcriptional regulator, Fis family n=1 Tax=Thiocapsa marina 5811 TaxID=768671 RepID=F9U5A8_9GAMM|nr:sigma-54 dependent transcriptional regulator [Thiocapsa marina]EGV20331.1 two component, sigma54 specific, transcriptional regulator, Fis family [Thiocapsa marina 5811]
MSAARPTVLLVDDEPLSLETLTRTLDESFEVLTATSAAAAEEILAQEWVQVIVTDQRMPETTGVEFLARVRERWPDVVRIIISGYTDPGDIIEGINRAGIYQYITKPWHPDTLLLTVGNACHLYRLQREHELLSLETRLTAATLEQKLAAHRARLKRTFRLDAIVRSPGGPLDAACDLVERVAPYDIPVLLTGESGTGKELFARALHYNSHRADKPFVAENCGAMPDQLLESELFGHKKGAFTGAVNDRIGLFEQADGGTIFLDEIGEVSRAFQVKLLRVLQEGDVRPLGSNQRRRVDVRVVAATNRSLETEIDAGRFREDLYYRLAAVRLHLPPLRERPGDIPVLARHHLEAAMAAFGKPVTGLSDALIDRLQRHHWPGNVRELQNEIQRMLVMCDDNELGADLLDPGILGATARSEPPASEPLQAQTLKARIEALEVNILGEALERNRWNKSQTAAELGLSRVGLSAKIERYGLSRPQGNDRRDPS